MPTITYNHEPTDEVYMIAYSDDLKAETVVKGTVYRVDASVNTKGVDAVVAVPGVPAVEAVEYQAAIPAVEYQAAVPEIPAQDAIAQEPTPAEIQAAVELEAQKHAEWESYTSNELVTFSQAYDIALDTYTQKGQDHTAAETAEAQFRTEVQAAQDAINGGDTSQAAYDRLADAQAELTVAEAATAQALQDFSAAGDAKDDAKDALDDANDHARDLMDEIQAANMAQSIVTPAQAAVEYQAAVPEIPAQDAVAEVLAVEAVAAIPPVQAVSAIPATVVVKYIIRTQYNESITVQDESLLFANKSDAFDALELRTA